MFFTVLQFFSNHYVNQRCNVFFAFLNNLSTSLDPLLHTFGLFQLLDCRYKFEQWDCPSTARKHFDDIVFLLGVLIRSHTHQE